MPIYRILAFFQKYDILGRFHTDVLLDDLFAGFASDCANFAEIQSDALLQEDISGYKSTSTFGGTTETIEINHSINPIVYSDVFGDFHSPVLLAHKAEGLSADAKFGKHDSTINLSRVFKGLQSAATFGGIDSSVFLPSRADGFKSTPTYGATDESIIGESSVKDFVSTAVFGSADETVEFQSSIKATVTTPTEYYIEAGAYRVNNTSPTPTAWSIDFLFSYRDESTASVVVCSKMETKYEYIAGFQSYAWALHFDSTIIGFYSSPVWLIFTHPDYPTINVLARTAVTAEQKAEFDSIFYKV